MPMEQAIDLNMVNIMAQFADNANIYDVAKQKHSNSIMGSRLIASYLRRLMCPKNSKQTYTNTNDAQVVLGLYFSARNVIYAHTFEVEV